jgi:hypothetical protein
MEGGLVLKRAKRWQHHVANSAVDRQSVMKSRLGLIRTVRICGYRRLFMPFCRHSVAIAICKMMADQQLSGISCPPVR